MQLTLLFVTLALSIGASANPKSLVYEMIFYYKAYMLDYKANGAGRSIAATVNHIPPAVITPDETDFLQACDDNQIKGIASFDEFCKAILNGALANDFHIGKPTFDPVSVDDFNTRLKLDPNAKAVNIGQDWGKMLPAPKPTNLYAAIQRFQAITVAAQTKLAAANADGSDFVKETRNKLLQSLRTSKKIRQQAATTYVTNEVAAALSTTDGAVFKSVANAKTPVTIKAWDATQVDETFDKFDTNAVAKVQGTTKQDRDKFLTAIWGLALTSKPDKSQSKEVKASWNHGAIINEMGAANKELRTLFAGCNSP